MKKLFKDRRGSLLLVITYGALMAFVVLGMLQVASALYSTSRDSAKIYSDIQNYRSACEMACYKYITDLETVTVTKDLSSDWISVSEQAIYTQALASIQDAIADPTDSTKWKTGDIIEALNGANLSDPSVLTYLLGRLADVDREFSLVVPEPIKIDWSSPNSWSQRDSAQGWLYPVRVEVRLKVRGESLFEQFDVSDFFLQIDIAEYGSPPNTTRIATMRLAEGPNGVKITRVVEE